MNTEQSYSELLNHIKKTHALGQVAGLISWDQETMMPRDGAEQRADQSAALEATLHQRKTDPRLGDLLSALENSEFDGAAQANIKLTKRAYDRYAKIPVGLSEELARTTSLGQRVWADARAANTFQDFAPTLEKIIELKRQEADCIADSGTSRYDALLNDFEPGMTSSVLKPLLEGMRPRLAALREKIEEAGAAQPELKGNFSAQDQLALAKFVASAIGYNFDAGRLDISSHPFSSGTGGDSRITTRIDAADPMGCLYSTIHEVGHALYEQGVPNEHALTPAGQHVSMGVHESQSRLWENQVGRSKAFSNWLYPEMVRHLGDFGLRDANELHRAINRVETGFIRTESDEVHYNLHILLRYELEAELISGALEVADLEEAWNSRFKRDFGRAVPNAANGVLQDIHWSVGLFGYFPTYSLGNIYAGQLNVALEKQLGDLRHLIEAGQTSKILDWLREHVHQKGSIYSPSEVIEQAVGEPVSSDPLLTYLETKYGELFGF